MITVGIDATQIVSRRTGLGRYQEDLLAGLQGIEGIRPVLITSPDHILGEDESREVRILPRSLSRISPGLALLAAPARLMAGLDLFFASRVLRPLRWHGKTLTVVHDLAWLENSRGMQTLSCLAHRLFANRMITGSETVVSDSPRTTRQLHRLVSDRLAVQTLPPQISEEFHVCRQVKPKPGRMLLVGGQSPGKNGVLALQLFAMLARENDDLELVIVGGKSWKNKKLYQTYAALAGGIRQRVRMAGFVTEDKLIELYQGSVLTLFPSFYEGYGYPALESMACGTPVLASENIPTADYLPEKTYVLPPHDVQGWYRAATRILAEPDLHRQRFEEHWQRVRLDFSRESYTSRIVELIRDTAAG